MKFNAKRVKSLNNYNYKKGCIVYWMSQDQRVLNNWALIFSQLKSKEFKQPLVVVFNLETTFLEATWRQYDFMIKGLKEVEETLKKKNIPFYLLVGETKKNILNFLEKYKAGYLITDFSPLKIKQNWLKDINKKITIPFKQVDASNIVPVWEASNKQEYAARTIRPKINKQLKEFLTPFPNVKTQKFSWKNNIPEIKWSNLKNKLNIDFTVKPVDKFPSGEEKAKKLLRSFLKKRLNNYHEYKNFPEKEYISNLSPYLHFGQISAQYVALKIKESPKNKQAIESFLEELIIRRELAQNFCYYNKNYDNHKSFPQWAQISLEKHKNDKKEYTYPKKQLENAQTHDEIWNACEKEMLFTGKMHGYMRMYWAKKILEWSKDYKTALKTAIYLNDKYELDGRDPNGYTGVAWSIGGLHDQGWKERKIYGKVRYMSKPGLERKFNIKEYIKKQN